MSDYRIEFPQYPVADMPALPDGWNDVSWHNNACPCFENVALRAALYIDYLKPEDREFQPCDFADGCGGGRFVVFEVDSEGCFTDDLPRFAFDTLAEALAKAATFTEGAK